MAELKYHPGQLVRCISTEGSRYFRLGEIYRLGKVTRINDEGRWHGDVMTLKGEFIAPRLDHRGNDHCLSTGNTVMLEPLSQT